MTSSDIKYWLAFSAFPGIGPLRFKLLMEYFGNAKNAWEAKPSVLQSIGLGEKLVSAFMEFKRNFSPDTYINVLKSKKINVITLYDDKYPRLLKEIPDAPYVLYIRGSLEFNTGNAIAVVGTRKMSQYGQEVTKTIVTGLIDNHLTVVSGLAYGIDTVVHKTAIENNSKTIAVLGCGVDIIHPASNRDIYWQITKGFGCVISEYPPGRFAARGLFPARNRIISGLSLGTVVVEGAKDSGALITARYAAAQGRDVFAVPGPITSYLSEGPNNLIKQGAKPVTEIADILDELNIDSSKPNIKNSDTACYSDLDIYQKKIVKILEFGKLHFDEIVRNGSISPKQLAGILTVLEMKNVVVNLGSGIYYLRKKTT